MLRSLMNRVDVVVGQPPARSAPAAGLRREELALLAGICVDYLHARTELQANQAGQKTIQSS